MLKLSRYRFYASLRLRKLAVMRQFILLFILLFVFSCGEPERRFSGQTADTIAPAPGPGRTSEHQRGDRPDKRNKSEFCQQEEFAGHSRAVCKVNIAKAQTESFASLDVFWNSLPGDKEMSNHNPRIKDDSAFGRVKEEMRNVRIKKTWLLAVKREDDGDFHLIIGNKPSAKSDILFNAEISGLPETSSGSYDQLKKVRDYFKAYFNQHTCFHNYKKFYDEPKEISISGSLFYDIEHTPPGTVGPKDLKTATAWEIHPVTEIVFLK
ncbi:MAG: hypothetical protein FD123_1774 [Bacteroidetes bacterium]|nr:MAG: hypothetical protein FD123_1774 [Bacteroidota bacterium]